MNNLFNKLQESLAEKMLNKIIDNKRIQITIDIVDKPNAQYSLEMQQVETPLTLNDLIRTKRAIIGLDFEDKKGKDPHD